MIEHAIETKKVVNYAIEYYKILREGYVFHVKNISYIKTALSSRLRISQVLSEIVESRTEFNLKAMSSTSKWC